MLCRLCNVLRVDTSILGISRRCREDPTEMFVQFIAFIAQDLLLILYDVLLLMEIFTHLIVIRIDK